jgi:HK97 family phage prohead protease
MRGFFVASPTPKKAMEIKRKNYGCSIKAANQEEGVLEAIVNVFNIVDRTNEITRPGLFAESLEKKLPRGVWHHRWDQPIARTLEAKELLPEDPLLPESLKHLGGLYIRAQFVKEIDDSWQAFLKIKHGFIDEFSIGYDLSKTARDDESGTVELLKGEWFEWSPVLVGANQATEPISIKSLSESEAIDKFLKGVHTSTLEEHSDAVLDAVDGLIGRLERHAEKRLENSSRLSESQIERIGRHAARLSTLREKGPISQTQDTADADRRLRAEVDREFLKTMRTQIGV